MRFECINCGNVINTFQQPTKCDVCGSFFVSTEPSEEQSDFDELVKKVRIELDVAREVVTGLSDQFVIYERDETARSIAIKV